MDLLDQLRDMRDRRASTLSPAADPEDDRYRALIDQAVTLMTEAPDADLVRAYQRTTRKPNDLEADMLLAEISRRGIDV